MLIDPFQHSFQVLLNGCFQRLLVGADHLSDLLTLLEQHERRHGTDSKLLSDVGDLIDIDLVEASLLKFFCHLDYPRGNDLARTAPRGKAVKDDESIFCIRESFVEVGFAW